MTRLLGRAVGAAVATFGLITAFAADHLAPLDAIAQGAPSARTAASQSSVVPPTGPVIGAVGLSHGVENVEASVAYYRQAFGFELIGSVPPSAVFDLPLQALTTVGGGLYRTATLKIPGSSFGLQLLEVSNGPEAARHSERQATARPTDRGATVLRLPVPQIAGTLANVEKARAGDGRGGSGRGGGIDAVPAGKTLFVRNRDGFVTEIVESGQPGAPAGLIANGASIALTAGDAAAKIQFYRDILGFDLKTGEAEASQDVLNALGAEGGTVRRSLCEIPGTKILFEIDEFAGFRQRRAIYNFTPQPGAVTLQLVVRDMDAIMKVLIARRVRIVTTALRPVKMAHSRNVIVSDPDGVYVELIERD